MKRDALGQLETWKRSPHRKPLILQGARQVGKTWILKEFARTYPQSTYLNFEEDPKLRSLFETAKPDEILSNIELYSGGPPRDWDNHLLILDEIQVCSAALNSLKYFHEHAAPVHVAAAGSLFGIRLAGPQSFPVGKVDFLELWPLTFFEFLDAHDETQLRRSLEDRSGFEGLPDAIHDKLIALVKRYTFVGGMPEPVERHRSGASLSEVRAVQHDILRGYALDFSKYAPATLIPKLSLVWESIPTHLGRENKKFMFSALRKGARARGYEDAIAWLCDARLALKCHRVTQPTLPLKAQANSSVFKVYALDVGLLSAMTRLESAVLLDGSRVFEEFRGALTENYVAQELVAHGHALHYWASSGGRAELDFIHAAGKDILPLEVKAGINARSRSLRSYDQQFAPRFLCRTTALNFKKQGHLHNYPLYAASRFPELSYDSDG